MWIFVVLKKVMTLGKRLLHNLFSVFKMAAREDPGNHQIM